MVCPTLEHSACGELPSCTAPGATHHKCAAKLGTHSSRWPESKNAAVARATPDRINAVSANCHSQHQCIDAYDVEGEIAPSAPSARQVAGRTRGAAPRTLASRRRTAPSSCPPTRRRRGLYRIARLCEGPVPRHRPLPHRPVQPCTHSSHEGHTIVARHNPSRHMLV